MANNEGKLSISQLIKIHHKKNCSSFLFLPAGLNKDKKTILHYCYFRLMLNIRTFLALYSLLHEGQLEVFCEHTRKIYGSEQRFLLVRQGLFFAALLFHNLLRKRKVKVFEGRLESMLVSIYAVPEMKLCSLLNSRAEF
jgi:hypothetical protein